MKKISLILLLGFSFTFAQNVSNIENKHRLAQTYEMNGQLDKAQDLFRELIQLQPFNTQYLEELNRILINQKKYNESINLLENRLKEYPMDASVYGLLGSTYFMMDNIPKAYEVWDKGVATSPNSNVVYRVIANYAIENRAFEKAIELLKKGKELAQDKFIFSIDLSSIYALNMNFESAANEICEMVITRPDLVGTAKSRFGTFINRSQAAAQTIETVRKFLDSNSTPEIYELLSFVYQQTGNYDKAFDVIKDSEDKFNKNGASIYSFALEAYRNKKFEAASNAYKFILEKYPSSSYQIGARIGYARTLEETLNQKVDSSSNSWKPLTLPVVVSKLEYEKIVTAYQDFIKQFPNNPVIAEACFRSAEIYRNRLYDFNAADSLYRLIENQFPYTNYSSLSEIGRGKIYLRSGNLDEAKNSFEKVLSNGKSDPQNISEANYFLAKIEFWKGNFTLSIKLFKDITKNLEGDFANDALESSFFVNSTKKDSINLLKYSTAEFLLLQNNYKQAVIEFKTLGDNDNLFIINQFARLKLAEIFLADDDFLNAEQIFEKLSLEDQNGIFVAKSMFLLAQTQKYGEKNIEKAAKTYQKILEKFPNSIYFDRVRDELNAISN